jgi:hypothetical protein
MHRGAAAVFRDHPASLRVVVSGQVHLQTNQRRHASGLIQAGAFRDLHIVTDEMIP